MISIASTARPDRPVQLHCPDPSDLPLGSHSGPIGLDISAQMAPTWVAGPSKVAIPLQSGIEFRKAHDSMIFVNKSAKRMTNDAREASKLTK